MLKQALTSINIVLNELISITTQDIEDIKLAKHEALFQRNEQKEKLLNKFTDLKSQIDSILVQRSQSGKSLEELISPQEDILLDEFRNNLKNFYNIHKKFSKMALLVTNFYNNLIHKISGSEPDIGYEMKPNIDNHSNISLKA
jgi:ElaB/YqjD/DUF883 family membrane-anchored ribosome-binding protein